MTAPSPKDDWRPWVAARLNEIMTALLFSTRLPLRRVVPIGGSDLAHALWALPLAGILVGLIGGVVFALAHRLGLFAWPAAGLAVAAMLLVTGCLHEDGLADTADGFGGGATRDDKLAIMRDARIGAYGVCALIVSILMRAGALATIAEPRLVIAALIAAHAAARAALPVLMFFVPPARADGLSYDAGQPPREQAVIAAVLGLLVLAVSLGIGAAVVAAVLLAIGIALMARLSLSQIGGQTGDVLGALEQVSEIVVLLVAVR